jgi:hypothetical protein
MCLKRTYLMNALYFPEKREEGAFVSDFNLPEFADYRYAFVYSGGLRPFQSFSPRSFQPGFVPYILPKDAGKRCFAARRHAASAAGDTDVQQEHGIGAAGINEARYNVSLSKKIKMKLSSCS